MDKELKNIENQLRKLCPKAASEALIDRLDQAMTRWHEALPIEEKLIPFSNEQLDQVSPPKKPHHFTYGRVLLACLAGLLTAYFVTATGNNPNELAQHKTQTLGIAIPPNQSIVQSGTQNKVSSKNKASNYYPSYSDAQVIETRDQGIVYLKNGQAMRKVAVTYNFSIQLKNKEGDSLQVQKPKIKIVYIPLKID